MTIYGTICIYMYRQVLFYARVICPEKNHADETKFPFKAVFPGG